MTKEEWNTQMNRVYELTTQFNEFECGCVHRGDGYVLTYCGEHNTKFGTHRVTSG
jgi:hypothetical protein